MRLVAALICDYAEIREGLLTIVSAGITRLWRDSLPAPMEVFLALQLEVSPQERPFPHEVRVEVTGPSRRRVAEIRAALQVAKEGNLDPDEPALMSIPLDLRSAAVSEYGWHTITISVDSEEAHALHVKVAPRPAPASAAGIGVAPSSFKRH